MADERPPQSIHLAPPLIDLAGTRGAAPPASLAYAATPSTRPPRSPRRGRWIAAAIVVVLLGAGIAGGIAWRSAQNAPLPWYANTELGTGIGAFGPLDERLDTMLLKYETADDDGTLWDVIPETRANRTGLAAFRFFLTDMKIAASFGPDPAESVEYATRADDLERLFLAEQPLGDDIEIAFSEDRIFRYDGETGEGGFATE